MNKEFHLTKEGINKLEKELEDLKSKRTDIAEKLKIAREYGDLSENAEYHEAREEQAQLEGRVKEIEHILKNVEVIDKPSKKDIVELGNTVTLNGEGKEHSYTIVGSFEADPMSFRISDESPIGKALLGKKIGEKVEIELPTGKKQFTIKKVA